MYALRTDLARQTIERMFSLINDMRLVPDRVSKKDEAYVPFLFLSSLSTSKREPFEIIRSGATRLFVLHSTK